MLQLHFAKCRDARCFAILASKNLALQQTLAYQIDIYVLYNFQVLHRDSTCNPQRQ